jgi:hypothetical protein
MRHLTTAHQGNTAPQGNTAALTGARACFMLPAVCCCKGHTAEGARQYMPHPCSLC